MPDPVRTGGHLPPPAAHRGGYHIQDGKRGYPPRFRSAPEPPRGGAEYDAMINPQPGLTPETLRGALLEAIPDAVVVVESPDGRHFSARIVSESFTGLPLLERHRRVYRALGRPVGGAIHALTLETLTPAESQRART